MKLLPMYLQRNENALPEKRCCAKCLSRFACLCYNNDMRKVALIGLGNIAQVAVQAMDMLKEIEIVGGYDTAGKPTWWGDRAWSASLSELLALNPDVVMVATPSTTHPSVIREIWSRNPDQRILVEKPLAVSSEETRKLLAEARPHTLAVLYHAAYAPEVGWAKQMLSRWQDTHGTIERYICFFSDPYDTAQMDTRRTSVYESSWVDSGINCLSILRRLDLVKDVVDLSWDRSQRSTAIAHTSFGDAKYGTIITQWTVTAPSKSTILLFTDRTTAVIDHQATAGRVITASNEVEAIFGLNSDVPRLVRHYKEFFHQELIDEQSLFTADDHLSLHEMLLRHLGAQHL